MRDWVRDLEKSTSKKKKAILLFSEHFSPYISTMIDEYRALKVFEGKSALLDTSKIPASSYRAWLSNFLTQEEIEICISDFIDKGYIEFVSEEKAAKLTQSGKEYLDWKYFERQVYEIIDTALEKLKKSDDGKSSIRITHRSHRIQLEVEKILEKHDLVRFIDKSKGDALAEIKKNGYDVLEKGGIQSYLKQIGPEESATMMHQSRTLAAILFTDIVSFTAIMQRNEEQARVIIKRYNSVLEKFVAAHHGKVVNYYGDGSSTAAMLKMQNVGLILLYYLRRPLLNIILHGH